MPYIKPVQNVQQVNFLASQNFQSFTTVVPANQAGAVNGIVKAGTIFPSNDASAKGILLHDVDISNGAQPAALIVAGYILEDRLPAAPDAAAVTALKDIRFQ